MLKKLLSLTLLLGGLHILDACCSDDKPYFDYEKLFLQNEILSDSTGTKTVTILIAPSSVEYFASILTFRCTERLYGTSCPEWGRDGLKDPIVDIEITADQDFTTGFPAGTSLKSFFQWSFEGTAFHSFPLDTLFFEYGEYSRIELRTFERPDSIGVPFKFNVSLLRGSGKTVSDTTLPVIWQ